MGSVTGFVCTRMLAHEGDPLAEFDFRLGSALAGGLLDYSPTLSSNYAAKLVKVRRRNWSPGRIPGWIPPCLI